MFNSIKGNKSDTFKSEIFGRVVDSFKEKNIPFCVFRNYERYPEEIGGDIDALVLPELLDQVDRVIQEVANDTGSEIWDHCRKREASRMPRAILWFGEKQEIKAIHFDFFYQLEASDVRYENVYSVIERIKPFKKFFILDKKTEFLHIIMHGMFTATTDYYTKRYTDKIRKYLDEGRKIPENSLRRIFPSFIASSIIKNLKDGKVNNIFRWRRIKKILFIVKGGLFFKKLIPYSLRKLKKILNIFYPPGEFVVILGPDGVGKSTTAELTNQLLECFSIPSHHFHLGFRPALLPSRQRIGLKEPRQNSAFLDLLRYFYHFFDYVFAYYVRVRPRLVRGEIVIAERYFYDYILHLPRKQMTISKKLVWWTFRLFMPKPTACVLLTNSSEEILKRRQELTKEEIVEVLQKGEELGKTVRRFIKLKTDKPPEKIALQLIKWLLCKNS
ncbi:MAG TPA: hypothetical protein ENH86_00450 [Candidatus Jorgensenbacteria bacterium]|nr:hypothetical protein [Candidatus Jorgensenbacteria bacterium]